MFCEIENAVSIIAPIMDRRVRGIIVVTAKEPRRTELGHGGLISPPYLIIMAIAIGRLQRIGSVWSRGTRSINRFQLAKSEQYQLDKGDSDEVWTNTSVAMEKVVRRRKCVEGCMANLGCHAALGLSQECRAMICTR